ncbi:hypothetical protein, partial [Gelidibacter japonicus]|uniref:hypothetical protein n=1 Tax=Gelidibacter japonicus TaxID=1962232 RepID=UPI0019662822
ATSYHQKGRGLTSKEGQNVKRFLIFEGMVRAIAPENKDRLQKLNPSFCEPPYTRPVRTVV